MEEEGFEVFYLKEGDEEDAVESSSKAADLIAELVIVRIMEEIKLESGATAFAAAFEDIFRESTGKIGELKNKPCTEQEIKVLRAKRKIAEKLLGAVNSIYEIYGIQASHDGWIPNPDDLLHDRT